jgi:hypothetical protein
MIAWLSEDLASSACVWSRIALFMRARTVDFRRLNAVERGKHNHSPPGRRVPASCHEEDDAFIAAVGLVKNQSVQGGTAPIVQLRVHVRLCLNFANKRTT